MSRQDWYRNAIWNDDIAAAFESKLRRARSKEQYLRIQACTLTESHPEIAHSLLDRYFELPNQFDAAQAHVDRANAFLARGKVHEAVSAYEGALVREAIFPNLRTQAYIELPYLVATRKIHSHYFRAQSLLDEHKERLMFAVDHFKWNAAQALITHALGKFDMTHKFARAALDAASQEHSGFRYHPTVGLIPNTLAEVHERIRRMCDA
jgi:hypothetical protein